MYFSFYITVYYIKVYSAYYLLLLGVSLVYTR